MMIILLAFTCVFCASAHRAGSDTNYVGSEVCVSCHADLHPGIVHGWQNTAHHLSMRRVDETIHAEGDFDLNSSFNKEAVTLMIGRRGPRCAFIDESAQVLPLEWMRDESVWVERGSADATETCFGCHATGYFLSNKKFSEPGVGCEACHGPGKNHADSVGGAETIVNPAALSPEKNNMVCGQCHSMGKDPSGKYPFPVAHSGSVSDGDGAEQMPYQPGQDLTTAFVDAKPLVIRKGKEYSLLVQAPEYYAMQLCTDCHDPHGRTENPNMLIDATSGLCLKCHGDSFTDLELHWGADKAPCWECHEYVHTH